jgi:hypothetical protein
VPAEQRRLLIAGAVYLALGLWISSFFGTWSDEEYTLATTGHGIAYAAVRALSYELQAPLYFSILAGWREIDGSVWFARLFSLLCATAFFFAVAKIGKRIAPHTDPLPFALLVALNPFVVFAAFEIRLYALALLISALLWLCYDEGFASGTSRSARLGFVALAIAGTYVQYFLAFMLIGFGCALLVRGRSKIVLVYIAYCLVAVAAIVPLVFVAKSQAGGVVDPGSSRFGILSVTALHPWIDFFYPHLYSDESETAPQHVGYAALAIAVAGCWVWARPHFSRSVAALFVAAAAIECVYVAAAVAIGERLSDRYFVALFVPVAAAAYALERASIAKPAIPQRIAVAAFALMTGLSLVTHYRFLAQNGDWKRVAAYLGARARPGDVIAIYPSDSIPAFERQYAGHARVVPFPRSNPTDRYVLGAVDVNSADDARRSLARLEPYRTLWFVDAVRCLKERPENGCDYLLGTIAGEYRAIANERFYMNRVFELTRRSGASSQSP